MLRFIGAGALALALLLPGPVFAAGYPLVTGKCGCAIGWGLHIADCGSSRTICTRAMCARACQAKLPAKTSDSWDAERPRREGHEFTRMWSHAAALEPTDVSSARRMRHAWTRTEHSRPVAVAAGVSDHDGRYLAAPAAETPQRPRLHARATPGSGPGAARRLAAAAIDGGFRGGEAVEHSRPRDCYGIAWCGCWLRTVLGIADRSLNLASNWARVGSPASPDSANVVVWHHHVGKLLAHEGGRILIQSGNDRGAVRTRWVSPGILGGVIAYRRV